MQVPSNIYHVFYDNLWQEFLTREIPEDRRSFKVLDIWDWELKDSTGKSIKITKDRFGTSPHYFYKLRSLAKENGVVPVNNKSLSKALYYLGIPHEKNDKPDISNWGKEAQYMLNEFIKHKMPNTPLIGETDGKQKSSSGPIVSYYNEIPEFRVVMDLVTSFHECIQSSRLVEAWQMLTPRYQVRSIWRGNFDRFKSSFVMTQSKRNIKFENLTYKFGNILFSNYYWETYSIYDILALHKLANSKPMKPNAPVAQKMIKTINAKLNEYGIKSLDKLDDKLLNDYDFQKYIWYLCDHNTSLEKLTKFKSIETLQQIGVSCILFNNEKWLIDDLTSLAPELSINSPLFNSAFSH